MRTWLWFAGGVLVGMVVAPKLRQYIRVPQVG